LLGSETEDPGSTGFGGEQDDRMRDARLPAKRDHPVSNGGRTVTLQADGDNAGIGGVAEVDRRTDIGHTGRKAVEAVARERPR